MAKKKSDTDQSDTSKKSFKPETLDRTVIALPLLEKLNEEMENPSDEHEVFPVIIDLNLEYPGGLNLAREWVIKTTERIIGKAESESENAREGINYFKSDFSQQYLFAALEGETIRKLVNRDSLLEDDTKGQAAQGRSLPHAIYHIWPDFEIRTLINKSISTVKADAAQTSFSAYGEGIVWAVIDSGIDGSHPHFLANENLEHNETLVHKDFTRLGPKSVDALKDDPSALKDAFGHGTHVAGIIAGELEISEEGKKKGEKIRAYSRQRDEKGNVNYNPLPITSISGMAPRCKLLSLKVLDDEGKGAVSNIIAAIALIQQINGYGRRLLIHGVNLSVGYDFDPEWFACGQSPLCVEVDRLVRSGVVVVVAAGNTGYGTIETQFNSFVSAGMDLTINDPGNAELAITVGSTHKDMPHVYGVSYFSSKGPTGDGRAKPDLVAPGEKIISCASGKQLKEMQEKKLECDYVEESGTSMAAPHVSGAIAAFLSIRKEFVGRPDKVKEIFLSTATDLKRERYFQGYGLVDLMRAIQSV